VILLLAPVTGWLTVPPAIALRTGDLDPNALYRRRFTRRHGGGYLGSAERLRTHRRLRTQCPRPQREAG